MKKNVGAVLLLLAAWGDPSWAETDIWVRVKGEGTPVANATLVQGETLLGTTDALGKAKIEVMPPANVRIVAPDFVPADATISENTRSLTVFLVPRAVSTIGWEITSPRVVQSTSKFAMSAEESLSVAGSHGDPAKAIQSLPGVVSQGEFGGGVYMRGSDGIDNAVWIDRLQVPYAFHWAGDTSVVNPKMLQDINVVLAGFPVEYPTLMGGAIDVKLREPKKDRLHQYYHMGTYQSGFFLEGPLGTANGGDGFYLGARRSYIDLLLKPDQFNKMIGANTDQPVVSFTTVPQFYDMQASWWRSWNKGALQVHYFNSNDNLALLLNRSADTNPALIGGIKQETGFHTVGAIWTQNWSPSLDQTTVVQYLRPYEDLNIGTNPQTGQPYYVKGTYHIGRFHPEWRFHIGDNDVTTGFETEYDRFPINLEISAPPTEGTQTQDFTTAPKYSVHQTINAAIGSAYIKYRQVYTPAFNSTIGVRYTKARASGGVDMQGLMPRAAAEYRVTDALLLSATWGTFLQPPQNFQMANGFGNPGLSFQRSEHRVVGAKYEFSPVWNMTLEAYQKRMSDVVIDVDNVLPPENYVNEGEGQSYGVDFYLRRAAQGRKMGWVGYSYGRSTRTNLLTGATRNFSGDQRHTFTLVWGEPFWGSWSNWSWSTKISAHSGLPYTAIVKRTAECIDGAGVVSDCAPGVDPSYRWRADYGPYNGSRLPWYFKMDVRINWEKRFDTWRLNYYFDVQNVTNRLNVNGYDYGAKYQYIDDPRVEPGFPFMPMIGLEILL